jgi:hypothetical protein
MIGRRGDRDSFGDIPDSVGRTGRSNSEYWSVSSFGVIEVGATADGYLGEFARLNGRLILEDRLLASAECRCGTVLRELKAGLLGNAVLGHKLGQGRQKVDLFD